ncbi:MAG TPA: riboflavin biosynthesis protein RibF [Clostridia bacterium]|nr:riboflavin biosynthesis protein RibF [Clostridia bacterium]
MEVFLPNHEICLNGPTAVALGFFDGVHLGHAAVIQSARLTGLQTVVITFLQHPGGKKTLRLMSNRQKEEAFQQLGVEIMAYLDFPQVKDLEPEEFVRDILDAQFHAKKVFCGFNYHFGRGAVAGSEELKRICGKYSIETGCVEPVYSEIKGEDGPVPISSTLIRGFVENGEMEQAAACLGRPYAFCYEVVSGRRLGRQLGTPTINQKFPEGFMIPRFGVYASRAYAGGKQYPAVTNVGVKPTVGSDCVLAETYIIGYEGDLYGTEIKVELLSFLRGEKKFDGLVQLKNQIGLDAEQSISICRTFERSNT